MTPKGYHQRQARAARKQAAPPEDPLFERPAADLCTKQRYIVEMERPQARIDQVLWYVKHHLVGFAIVFSLMEEDGEWREQYSVDTSHGHFHEHKSGHRQHNDRHDFHPLRSQLDVQECYDSAYHMVHNRYLHWASGGK